MTPTILTDADAWRARADGLARWATTLLANRDDRCGGYFVRDGATHQLTRPPQGGQPGFLTPARLARHFRGLSTHDIVGVHALAPGSVGRWVAIDIDAHDGDGADPERNRRYAVHLADKMTSLGLRPLAYESNGRGGFHNWGVFDSPVPGPVLFAFARWLVADHREHGFGQQPETFPKQANIPPGGWGNWLRLPGRHHTRDFWPRVWSGADWLSGPPAVEHVLSTTGASPDAIPFEVIAAAAESNQLKPARVVGDLPRPPRSAGDVTDDVRPGDDFNARVDWRAVLERHGWRVDRSRGAVTFWTRPNKSAGVSGSTGFCHGNSGTSLLYVFTSAAPPLEPNTAYSPFGAYAQLEHGGDFAAAARALAAAGYGSPGRRVAGPKGVRS